jgi:hypothetical protein
MKVSKTFFKVYTVVMCCALFVGIFLMKAISYEALGATILIGTVFLFLGYMYLFRHQHISPQEKIMQDMKNPDFGPLGAFMYPWLLSFLMNIVLNYLFLEKFPPYVLIAGEIAVSALLLRSFLTRVIPELVKHSDKGLVFLFIIPISSVVAAFIFWPILFFFVPASEFLWNKILQMTLFL